MSALWYSIWLPFAGPLLFLALGRVQGGEAGSLMRWLDRASVALVTGAILFTVMPTNYRAIGAWSLALTGGVFGLAFLLARLGRRSLLGEDVLLALTLGSLFLHALADGAALFSFGGAGAVTFGPAIALDRFAIGFLICAFLAPRYGLWACLPLLALISAVTYLGYRLMEFVAEIVGNPQLVGGMQAVLAGLIAYMALHHGSGFSHAGHGGAKPLGLGDRRIVPAAPITTRSRPARS